MLKRIVLLFIPILLPGLAIYSLPYLQALPKSYQPATDLFPYIALSAALIFAWRFNRSRVFFLVVTLLSGYVAMHLAQHTQPELSRWLLTATALFIPLNFILLSLFKERGIFTRYGAIRFTLLSMQIAAIAWLAYHPQEAWLARLNSQWFNHAWLDSLHISQPALLLFVVALIWSIVRLIVTPKLVENGVTAVLIIAMLPLALNLNAGDTAVLFGLSGLLLLIAIAQESYSMAYVDELTNLPGRRAMKEVLMSLGSTYSIAMLDVDHFKKFNDTYGHEAGDQVLRMVAKKIKEVEGGGRPARYGGEEFAIIFPSRELREIKAHLEVVRERIESSPFYIRAKNRPKKPPEKKPKKKASPKQVLVTVSIGVAERTEQLTTPDEVMKAADKALYKAKKNGRNCLCTA